MSPPAWRGKARFQQPSQFPSPPLPPPLSLQRLTHLADCLVGAAKERSTARGYLQMVRRHWLPFLHIYRLPARPTAHTLLLFVAFAGRRIASVDKVLSAVRWYYALENDEWDKMRLNYKVVNALIGLRKTVPTEVVRSPPLLPSHVDTFVAHALRPGASFDDLLAATLAVVGFGALMRLGELFAPDKRVDRDDRKIIKRASVRIMGDDAVSFRLPMHKSDRLWHGADVTLVRANSTGSFSFVSLFRLYLLRRDTLFPSSPFLFLNSAGAVPSRKFFLRYLSLFASGLTGHALRAGSATYLASRGVRSEVIQRLGRWASSTWQIYLRDNPAVAAAVQRVDLARG